MLRNIIPEVIYPNLCDKQKNILSILYQQHNKIICTRPIILAIIFIFTLQIGIMFIIAKIIGCVRINLLCCWCRIFFYLSHKLGYITSGIIFLNNSQKNERTNFLLFMGFMIKYILLRSSHITSPYLSCYICSITMLDLEYEVLGGF